MNGGVCFCGRRRRSRRRRRGDTFFAGPLFQDRLRRLRRNKILENRIFSMYPFLKPHSYIPS